MRKTSVQRDSFDQGARPEDKERGVTTKPVKEQQAVLVVRLAKWATRGCEENVVKCVVDVRLRSNEK